MSGAVRKPPLRQNGLFGRGRVSENSCQHGEGDDDQEGEQITLGGRGSWQVDDAGTGLGDRSSRIAVRTGLGLKGWLSHGLTSLCLG